MVLGPEVTNNYQLDQPDDANASFVISATISSVIFRRSLQSLQLRKSNYLKIGIVVTMLEIHAGHKNTKTSFNTALVHTGLPFE